MDLERNLSSVNTLKKFQLDNKAAVVTGSGQGIGRGIALALADVGANLVINARRESDVAETAQMVRDLGSEAIEIVGDIREIGSEAIGDACIDAFGSLDIWVNNVGGTDEKRNRTLLDTPDEIFSSQLDLNLTTAFQGSKAAANRMHEGGCIINISSGAGMRGSAFTGPYAAAKAGMLNMTETFALELADRNIRVNAVSPGPVITEAYQEMVDVNEEKAREIAASIPLGRLGAPDDIATAVVFLSSDASSWITGQNILVSGGRTHRTVQYQDKKSS